MDRVYRFTDFFAPHLRFNVMLVCAALALMLASYANPGAAVPLIFGLYLLWDYCRNSGVWIGFRAFRQGNLMRVRRCVDSVRWPHLLSGRSLAYYHWLRGVTDVSDGRLQAARVHLLVAATGALRTENDRSLVQCLLAEIALQERDPAAAAEHLRLANALEHHADVARIITALRKRVDGAA